MTPDPNGRIYFDNAATTPLDSDVFEAMLPYLQGCFGNPSSLYSYGPRSATGGRDGAKVGGVLSWGAEFRAGVYERRHESNKWRSPVRSGELGCTHILYSPTEHHAVLHTVEHYGDGATVTRSELRLLRRGAIDLEHLANELVEQQALGRKCLVLYHACKQ
jgi:cysteine desulfurase